MGASHSTGCFSFERFSNRKLPIKLAILGLDNAGKTSTVLALAKEPVEEVAPTIGFTPKEITLMGQVVTLYDLGGGKNIRGIWKNYLAEVHGVVFVVDAADSSRIADASVEFNKICQNPYIKGKPVLILANKSDKPEALTEYDLTEQMNLEEIVNTNMVPTKVQASTVMSKDHFSLKEGMKWLYMSIISDWSNLNNRVATDTQKEQEKLNAERRERMERIKQEREREAAEGNRAAGDMQVADDEEDTIDGNPFKPLENHLEAKAKQKVNGKAELKAKDAKGNEASADIGTKQITDVQQRQDDLTMQGEVVEQKLKASDTEGDMHMKKSNGSLKENSEYNTHLFQAEKPLKTSLNIAVDRVPSPLPAPFSKIGKSPRLPPLPLSPIDQTAAEVTTKKKKRKKKARISPSASAELTNDSDDRMDNGGLLPVQEEVF